MFKFLKSLKPGGKQGKTATASAKPKSKTAKPQLSASSARPPNPMTPLSNGLPTPPKAQPNTAPAQFSIDGEQPVTPAREKLIKEALSIHRAQQNVFADLNDEAKHKLVLMAMLTLLKEARGDK